MKRLLLVLVALVLAFPVLAQTAPAPGVTPPDTPTTINMIGWRFPITALYAKELEMSNNVRNLKVNTQLLNSGDAQQQVRLALSGGGKSPYEIVQADDVFITELASNGWLMPLDDLIAKYKKTYDLGDIGKSLYALGSYKGHVYGIPIDANTMNFFYNMDLYKKYNLKVPATYDDVLANAQKLKQEPGLDLPFIINLHAGWAWRIEFHNFLIAYGGKWLNDDNTPAFNGPAGVKAADLLMKIVTTCMGTKGLTKSIDDTEIGLETGTIASANTWASRAANMDDPKKSKMVGKIGFAPAPSVVPGGPHAGPAAADFYCIPKNTSVNPELVFQVIMEATDLASQSQAASLGIVTRGKVAARGVGGRYLQAAMETIENGAGNYGPNPAMKVAIAAIENTLPQIADGTMTSQQVLDAAAALYVKEAKAQGFLK